jgi:hypothetical protein
VRRRLTPPVVWSLALVGVVICVVGGVGLVLFEPWRLFTSTTVEEAAPGPVASVDSDGQAADTAVVLARGTFISHEHDTTGSVLLLRLPDGSRLLRLENLSTSDGPDLRVWLTDAPVVKGSSGWTVFDDGRHVELGELKGNRGSQNYPVPEGTDVAGLTSVTIWCTRFHVSFGAAPLRPA